MSFGDVGGAAAGFAWATSAADPDLVISAADPDLVIFTADPDLVIPAADPDLGVPAGLTFEDAPPILIIRSARPSADGFGTPSDASCVSFVRNGGATRARPPVCAFCRRIRAAFPGVIMCGSLYPSMIICMIFSPAVIGIVGK